MAASPYISPKLYRFQVILYKAILCLCLPFFDFGCHSCLCLYFLPSGGDGDPGEDRSGSGLIQRQDPRVAVNEL